MADRKKIAIFGVGIRTGSCATRSQSVIHRYGGYRADPIKVTGRNLEIYTLRLTCSRDAFG